MAINLSQSYAPAGKVTFLITNDGTLDFIILVDEDIRAADAFVVQGCEVAPYRFDEDAKGLTNVGETGDPAMKPGTSKMLTIDMAEGRSEERRVGKEYNASGMHQDY